MRIHPTSSFLGIVLLAIACGGDKEKPPPAPAASIMYDDFSAGLSGAKWRDGEHEALLAGGKASLTQSAKGIEPNFRYNEQLVVRPPPDGQVTTLAADLTVNSASATGDSISRASIEILFQPPANRLLQPNANTNLLIARIALTTTASGNLVAIRQMFACTNPVCSTSVNVGTQPLAIRPAVFGTTYNVSISYTTAKVFTFKIVSGALTDTGTIDASAGAEPPFPVDLSGANFYRARLVAAIAGGATGGGDGSVAAQFDNVQVGFNFQAPSVLDDFETGSEFDGSRWTVGAESAQAAGGALSIGLTQHEAPSPRLAMEMKESSSSAVQADVTVTDYSHAGSGDIRALLQTTLYNDGVAGTASDPNVVDSQVGDLVASIGMNGSEAVYSVSRCDTVGCDASTFLQPFTSLGAAATGSTHTLYVNWDAPTHQVVFRLDGKAPVAFDPVAAGHALNGPAHRPLKRVGARASAGSATDPFGDGSSGSLRATFDNVRTN